MVAMESLDPVQHLSSITLLAACFGRDVEGGLDADFSPFLCAS